MTELLPLDPYFVLGVSREANDEEIRKAYFAKVKENPPEKHPEVFQQVRKAYEMLKDPDAKMRAEAVTYRMDPAAAMEAVSEILEKIPAPPDPRDIARREILTSWIERERESLRREW
ncbi:MAG: J domain-containing protein [Planctomycetota bacterium]